MARASRSAGVQKVLTCLLNDGRCPARGGRFTKDGYLEPPVLDKRCPEKMSVLSSPGEAPGKQILVSHIPVVESDSYCSECLHGKVREKEAEEVS
jgi:hypothetical protein